MTQQLKSDSMVWLRKLRHRIINLLLGAVTVIGAAGIMYSLAWRILIAPDQPSNLVYYATAYMGVLVLFWPAAFLTNGARLVLLPCYTVLRYSPCMLAGWKAAGVIFC